MNDDRLMLLRNELQLIKERNARVEADKAWEVSGFRIVSICLITYFIVAVLLFVIGAERWFLGALVPTVGYYLSTQSLPALKRFWISRRYPDGGGQQ